jgi:hypothetical protein
MSDELRKRRGKRRLIWVAMAFAALMSVVVAVVLTFGEPEIDPFPAPEEISSMRAFLLDVNQPLDFLVPPNHWTNVLNGLRPCVSDRTPAKWEGLGLLEVRRDGTTLEIGLYQTGEQTGAFSIEGASTTRTYYRGGDTNALKAALLEAYDASRSDKSDDKSPK